MFKAGYHFSGTNDSAVEYIETRLRLMSYMCDKSVEMLIREIGLDLIKYSNAFLIKQRTDKIPFVTAKGITSSGQPVVGYFRADPVSIYIEFDEDTGEIKRYKQIARSGKEKYFDPDDVIHFVFDVEAGEYWGTPRWIAALEDIRLLRKLEGGVIQMVYRYAMPLYHMIIGSDKAPEMYGTEKEVMDARNDVERAPIDGMFISTERTSIKVVGSEGAALDISPYLAYFEKRAFTALNTSESMMGRGGAKQDADSMEEQIHNAVKDDQQSLSIQIQHEIINELLIEGGFNPIINENDIVSFEFNEINLDTKIKTENHEVNKFQTNAQSFEEMRNHLGLKSNKVSEDRLYANMLEQKNAVEQIDINHKNAVELADITAEHNKELARINAARTANSSSSSSSSVKKNSSYTKKNTKNGKINKTKTSKAVSSIDRPKNQHGTFSVKVKENQDDSDGAIAELEILYDRIESVIHSNNKNELQDIRSKMSVVIGNTISSAAKKGCEQAYSDLGCQPSDIPLYCESDVVKMYSKSTLNNLFCDINKKTGNSTDETSVDDIKNMKYRVKYLGDFISKKSFWYSYIKTCASQGVTSLKVNCDENSRHSDHHDKEINPKSFSINDIPGYSANCHCYITPVTKQNLE